MKYKSAADVIECARERGFGLRVNPGPPPMPVLVAGGAFKARQDDATQPLMEALRAWRLEIIEQLCAEAVYPPK